MEESVMESIFRFWVVCLGYVSSETNKTHRYKYGFLNVYKQKVLFH